MQSMKVSPGTVLQEVVGIGKRDLFLIKTRENWREALSLLCFVLHHGMCLLKCSGSANGSTEGNLQIQRC